MEYGLVRSAHPTKNYFAGKTPPHTHAGGDQVEPLLGGAGNLVDMLADSRKVPSTDTTRGCVVHGF